MLLFIGLNPLVVSAGIEINDMPHMQAWMKRIEARPAVKRGLNVPEQNPMQDPQKKQKALEDARKILVTYK